MDPNRFDMFTRGVARRTNRRGVIAGFAAGVGAWLLGRTPAAARMDLALLPGSPCFHTEQCSQFGGPQVCADNGIPDDGPLNCCRVQAGACMLDSHCCGGLRCVNTFCVGDDQSNAGSGGDLGLGAACTETAECAPVSGGNVICGENYIDEDGPLNCCLDEGSLCSDSSECCGTNDCVGGYCGSNSGGDLAAGEYCVNSSQCSQALGPAQCATTSVSASPVCCLGETGACTTDGECCGDYICASNGIAGDGNLNCCGYNGAACTSDASCCADLFCQGGVCQPLS